ncbi:MAG: hypothetical protein ABS46_04615 [Cytophagaceae bacterium SCN 52-12]|nr:MAG: hypothetical protein ABS46_04615 [Cytophagaceae bacterium SCN 52-12]
MFSERLSQFIASIGETPTSFEAKIGVSKGAIYKPIRNGKTVGLEILVKIFSNYPGLDVEWLITGAGTMLKQGAHAAGGSPVVTEELPVGYSVMKGPRSVVRVIALRQAAGWDGIFEGRDHLVESFFYLPARMLPGGRNYAGFPVIENGMEPTLPLKSMLIAELVAPESYQRIQTGHVHVVITRRDIMIRRITNRLRERDALQAFADNSDYGPIDIPLAEISSVWKARALFSSSFSGERHQLYQLYQDLEERIRLLESRGDHPA